MKKLVYIMFIAAFILGISADVLAKKKIDPRVVQLQARLDSLAVSELASYGGEELKRAEKSIRRFYSKKKRIKRKQFELALYTSGKLIDIAETSAQTRQVEAQRKTLKSEQEKLVLEARTREAQMAMRMAEMAREEARSAMQLKEKALFEAAAAEKAKETADQSRLAAQLAQSAAIEKQRAAEISAEAAMSEAELAKQMAKVEAAKAKESQVIAQEALVSAEQAMTEVELAKELAEKEAVKARQSQILAQQARLDAEKAKNEAKKAREEMDSMRNRLSELEAKQTDRGLLVTLSDVLFELNQADLKSGIARNLKPLVDVLLENDTQRVVIEGHTDSTGARGYNMDLSRRRGDSVMHYLASAGIGQQRISVTGLGPDFPVASNDTAEGRQLNRRIEIILPN